MYLGVSSRSTYCLCQFSTKTYCVSIVWVLIHTTDTITASIRRLHLYNVDADVEIPADAQSVRSLRGWTTQS